MGLQGKFLVDWAWDLHKKQLLSKAKTRAAGGGEVKTGEKEICFVDAGAEVILSNLAEMSLLIYPGAGSL